MEWLGPIVWEYYAATEGAGTLVGPDEWLRKPGHRRQGRIRPTMSASSTTTGADAATGEIGTVYLQRPRRRPLRVLQGPGEDRRRVPRHPFHARRRRVRRRRRLPLPHRPQRAPHHQRRRQHLSGRGRGRAARAPGGRRRRCGRPARRRMGRGRGGGGRAADRCRGHRRPRSRARRVVPGPHRALQVSPSCRSSSRRCPGTTTASSTSISCASSSGPVRDQQWVFATAGWSL